MTLKTYKMPTKFFYRFQLGFRHLSDFTTSQNIIGKFSRISDINLVYIGLMNYQEQRPALHSESYVCM